MVLDRPGGPLRVADLPAPEPADDEVLIRVHACGVCRTDLHVLDGELPDPKLPLVPGHQIVGTVLEAGASVEDVAARGSRRRSLARLDLRRVPVLPLRPGEPLRPRTLHRLPARRRLCGAGSG